MHLYRAIACNLQSLYDVGILRALSSLTNNALVQMKARHGDVKRVEVEGGRLLQMALSSKQALSMT